MDKAYKKLLTNTALLTVGSFSSRFLGLLLIPFYTSVLSTVDYGLVDLISTTTALLFPFATVAISEAIMRFSLDRDSKKSHIYTIGLTVVLIGSVLVLCGYPFIRSTAIGKYTPYFVVYFVCYCLHTITSYFVKGLEKISVFSFSGVLSSSVVIASNLLLLLVVQMGLKGYLISIILGHAVAFVYLFVAAKLHKYMILPWKIERGLLKSMLRYSLPVIPNSMSWWIANSSDKYVLTHCLGLAVVGIYSVAYKLPTIFTTVMQLFISAWQLSAVEDFGGEKSKKFFSETYNKFFCINILCASLLILFTKPMARILFAKDFFEAYKYAPILILSSAFDALASFMGSIYVAAKKSSMLAISTVIGAGINIVFNFILIPPFGIWGAAVATVISYFVIWIVRLYNTRGILTFKIRYKRDFLMVGLLLLQIIFAAFDTAWGYVLCTCVCVGCCIYVVRCHADMINSMFKWIGKKFGSKEKQK